jgi:AcrR family transcriptional regulator
LDAAAELLASEGPDGTTITAVADRAGLATSSVYDYVEGDRELIGAVGERGLERIHFTLVELVGEPQTVDALRASMSSGLRMFLDRFKSEPGLKEALAFMDADPELAHINLADTRRNAKLVVDAAATLLPEAELNTVVLLMTHLSGALASLASRVEPDEAEQLIVAFEALLGQVLTS